LKECKNIELRIVAKPGNKKNKNKKRRKKREKYPNILNERKK